MRDAMPGAPLDFFRQARQGPVDPVFNWRGKQFARNRKRRLRFQWRTTGSGGSLDERKSRVTLAARLIGKIAAETISVILAVFDRIARTLRKSITFDNDTAFAQ